MDELLKQQPPANIIAN